MEMTPRILKKLSKRAIPMLQILGDTRQQFISGRSDSDTGIMLRRARRNRRRSFSFPLKGTPMIGALIGHEEPEWEEETVWEAVSAEMARSAGEYDFATDTWKFPKWARSTRGILGEAARRTEARGEG